MKINFLIFFTLLIVSCDPVDDKLVLFNSTKSNIYYYYSNDSTLSELKFYRSKKIKIHLKDSVYASPSRYIKKDSLEHIVHRGYNGWNRYMDKLKNSKLHLYVFLDTIVDKYSDSVIIKHNMYYKHNTYSKSDLEKSNWQITIN